VLALARENGAWDDPLVRAALHESWAGLQVLKHQALRTLSNDAASSTGVEANVNTLVWANRHRGHGELARRIGGPASLVVYEELDPLQSLFLFTRADTIYGGSSEVQRNIIAERHWGLPRDSWARA
jgi:alkylation response protein AidB-like acyl-CoA dehydrogenase